MDYTKCKTKQCLTNEKQVNERNTIGQANIGDYQASLTNEERIASARKAGIASGASRRRARERRTFQEDLLVMLTQPVPPTIRKNNGIDGGTWQQAVLLGLLKTASKGNPKAIETLSGLIGEKPKEELVIETKEKDGFDQALEQLYGTTESNEQEE